jgi:signal transduction histidine kinase
MVSLVLGVHLVVAVLTTAVAVLAVRHQRAPGARWFGVAMGGVTLWALLKTAEYHPAAQDPVSFSLVIRLVWVPNALIGVGILLFALYYTGRGEYVTRRRIAALSVVPVTVSVAALCHPILLDELAALLGPYGGVTDSLRPVAGLYEIVQVVGSAYVYILAAVASVLLLEVVAERPFPHPSQLLVLLAVVPPWVASLLQQGILHWETFNPTIVGFVFSGIAGLIAVGQFRLFTVPLARARIVEAVDSGVVVCGSDGAVYDYNERSAELLELSNDRLGTHVGRVLADSPLAVDGQTAPGAVSPTGSERRPEPVIGATPDGGQLADSPGGFDMTHLDGQTVAVEGTGSPEYVELQVSPLRDVSGDSTSHVLLLYDVSERERHRQELERKNEFLDEFASVVSHDVATPLGVIENKARLVEMTGDTSHVTDIYGATERVQSLVDELRDLAHEGVQVGETTSVALPEVTREAWQSVDSGDATLTIDSACSLEADRGRLRQLLENLLHNAVTHGATDNGTAPGASADGRTPSDAAADRQSVAIEVGELPDGFYVADDGPGIPPDAREQVFEQGYTTADDGRGLGLAIVDRIVQGHDWEIAITESDDGGARFEVDTDP